MTTDKQLAKIGQIITQALSDKKMSMYELAHKSGTRFTQIRNIRDGKSCNLTTLLKIDSILQSGVFDENIFADN